MALALEGRLWTEHPLPLPVPLPLISFAHVTNKNNIFQKYQKLSIL